MTTTYLPAGLPVPVPEADRVDAPYWSGLREGRLRIQQCSACGTWVYTPEWICHHCRSFELAWRDVVPRGRIHSWQRVWHPVRKALEGHGPYLIVLVELPQAPGVRLVGNLLGDPAQEVQIGSEVTGVFEPHDDADPPYTLLQWRLAGD